MPYPAKAVANFFLDRGRADGVPISPMKLQKLVYYAHGWHLGYTGEPLLDEQIECWDYGLVVRTLFHEFKEFGRDAIDRDAVKYKLKSGRAVTVRPQIDSEDEGTRELLEAVWNAYKPYSATKLSNMTHGEGEPWTIVFERHGGNPPKGTDIPVEVIRDHFRELTRTSEPVDG